VKPEKGKSPTYYKYKDEKIIGINCLVFSMNYNKDDVKYFWISKKDKKIVQTVDYTAEKDWFSGLDKESFYQNITFVDTKVNKKNSFWNKPKSVKK